MKAKHVFTTLALALTMGLGVAAGLSNGRKTQEAKATPTSLSGVTLYLDSTNWDNHNAEWPERYAVYTFGSEELWYDLELVDGELEVYSVTFPGENTNTSFILCRMDGRVDHEVNNWSNRWNQTENLEYDGSKNLYTITTAVPESEKYNGTWGTYVEKTDPSNVTKHFYVHDPNSVLGNIKSDSDVAKVNVYGFGQAATIKPAAMVWPGIHDGITTAVLGDTDVYEVELSESYPSFVMNCGDGQNQTDNVTDLADHVDGVLVIDGVKSDKTYNVHWTSDVDYSIPESDGYYLVGSKTGFKFEGATKMETVGIAAENCAELLNYSAEKDEKIKVRGFFNAENPRNKWSFYGGADGDLGEKDGSANFVLKKAAAIDIFAKWVKTSVDPEPEVWELQFFVTEHAERYDISIYDVLFDGSHKASVAVTPYVARATENVNFEYELPAKAGYVARGLFTNEDCGDGDAYTPSKFDSDGTLYAKYTKVGMYMFGDDTFSGTDLGWTVDGGTILPGATDNPDANLYEGIITITGATPANPVQVRPCYYEADGTLNYPTYSLGTSYEFAVKVGNNINFKEDGVYAIYYNKENQIWINAGADAFYTKFITEVGMICDYDGDTNVTNLKSTWSAQETAYNSLSLAEKNTIKAVGFNGGSESSEQNLLKMVAKYAYVVTKYASQGVNDFIWEGVHSSTGNMNALSVANNTTFIVILSSTITVIGAAGLFFVIRRKRLTK